MLLLQGFFGGICSHHRTCAQTKNLREALVSPINPRDIEVRHYAIGWMVEGAMVGYYPSDAAYTTCSID